MPLTSNVIPEQYELPDGWRWVRLNDVCIQDRQTIEVESPLFGELAYLSLEHIESNSGKILREPSEAIEDEGKSNTFQFDSRHVLFGKLRPYLNKVSLPNFKGRCTTELIPLLPYDCITREFLAWILRRQESVNAAMKDKTGSRMPRANMEALLRLPIPLPPLGEQKRIATILNESLGAVEQARVATEVQLNAAKALPAAYLREVFNSPEAEKREKRKLGEVCQIIAKQVDPKKPEFGRLPHVNGENIESGTCRLIYLNTASEDGMTSGKYIFESGDVLYSKLRPYLRKAVVVDFEGVCSADMYPIKVDKQELDSNYAAWLLVSDDFTKYADEESRRARMPKLNRDQLFAYEFPIPSLDTQRTLVSELKEKMFRADVARKHLTEQLEAISILPTALLRRAFRGEL